MSELNLIDKSALAYRDNVSGFITRLTSHFSEMVMVIYKRLLIYDLPQFLSKINK